MSQTKAQLIDPTDGSIVNADINASAAIAGSKISPDFGSQAITTTNDSVTIGNSIIHSGDTDTKINFPAANTFTINTAGSERFRVDSSGKVGIGVTNPDRELDISNSSGNCTISLRSSDSHTTQLLFGDVSAELRGRVGYQSSDVLDFYTAASERMRIDSSGNVGIGTSSPQSILSAKVSASRQLDVIKDSGDDHLVLKSTAPDASYNMRSIELAGSDVSFSTGASSGTSYTERLRIDSSGNVGIGTTSPNYELQVNDPSGTVSVVQLTNTTTGAGAGDGLLMYITGNDTIISNEEDGYMRFQTNGLERVRIDSSGRLLHGVTASVDVGSTASAQTQIHSTNSTVQFAIAGYGNNSGGAIFALGHSRSVGVGDASGQLSNNDEIGTIRFAASDGTDMENTAASITGIVDGNVSSNSTPGAIIFHTNNGSSHAEKLRIRAAGGITFNGDTAAANALDDYEEGTFTPAVTSGLSAGQIVYNSRSGHYTKIGRIVYFTFHINISSAVYDDGAFKFGGLPFTSVNDNNQAGGMFRNYTTGNFSTTATFKVVGNSTDIQVITGAGDATAANTTSFNTNNRQVSFSGFYRV